MSLSAKLKPYAPDLTAMAVISTIALSTLSSPWAALIGPGRPSVTAIDTEALNHARSCAKNLKAGISQQASCNYQAVLELGIAMLELTPYQRNVLAKEAKSFAPSEIHSTIAAVERKELVLTPVQKEALYWMALAFNEHLD